MIEIRTVSPYNSIIMQDVDFQTQVRPDALAREGAKHKAWVELTQMPRYASAVEGSTPLEVSLQYGRDAEGVYILTSLQATCQLLCQFCLTSYPQSIQANTRFRPVLTLEATREISPEDEPVMYENGFINVINMLEDDALLAIPSYPKCNACMHDNMADTFTSQFATMASSDL